MSGRQITSDLRVVTALPATSAYARISPSESRPGTYVRSGFEREPGERAGDQGRLAGLLCGLMHYAGRRDPGFTGAPLTGEIVKAIRRTGAAGEAGNTPDPADARDLGTFLTTLGGWSGLERPAVLGSPSTVLTRQDGHLLATPASARPAVLTAASAAGGTCFPHPVTRTAVPPEPRDGTPGHAARSPRDEQPRQRTGGPS